MSAPGEQLDCWVASCGDACARLVPGSVGLTGSGERVSESILECIIHKRGCVGRSELCCLTSSEVGVCESASAIASARDRFRATGSGERRTRMAREPVAIDFVGLGGGMGGERGGNSGRQLVRPIPTGVPHVRQLAAGVQAMSTSKSAAPELGFRHWANRVTSDTSTGENFTFVFLLHHLQFCLVQNSHADDGNKSAKR